MKFIFVPKLFNNIDMNHLKVAKWAHFKVTIIRNPNFLLLKSNNGYCYNYHYILLVIPESCMKQYGIYILEDQRQYYSCPTTLQQVYFINLNATTLYQIIGTN